MKKLTHFLLLLMFVTLTACGTQTVSAEAAEAETTPEAWGVAVEISSDTPEIINTVTNVTDTEEKLSEEEITELSELMMALIMCDFSDGMQYDPTDSLFFWRAMNYYAASVCFEMDALSEDMVWAEYSAEQVEKFAGRLFAETTSFPPLLDIGMIETRENGYAFALGNYGDVALELGEMKVSANGRFLMDATLLSGEESLGVWTFELMEIDGVYCISGILYG